MTNYTSGLLKTCNLMLKYSLEYVIKTDSKGRVII